MAMYGFIYVGLKEKRYYWEIVQYLKKLILITINSFLLTDLPFYRGVTGFIVLVLYLEIF
jgi:hypothetical protein